MHSYYYYYVDSSSQKKKNKKKTKKKNKTKKKKKSYILCRFVSFGGFSIYIKNQLVSWFIIKSNYHISNAIG